MEDGVRDECRGTKSYHEYIHILVDQSCSLVLVFPVDKRNDEDAKDGRKTDKYYHQESQTIGCGQREREGR